MFLAPSIADYSEALLNPEGRFRTLEGLRALRDEEGLPVVHSVSRYVEFMVAYEGARYLLCCPGVRYRNAEAERLCTALRSLSSPYLTSYRLVRGELSVDAFCGQRRIDVVLHRLPEGRPLDRFLAEEEPARCIPLLRSLAGMGRELMRIPFLHRNLTPGKVWIDAEGAMRLTGYHFAILRTGDEDNAALAALAGSIYDRAFAPRTLPADYFAHCADRAALCDALDALADRPNDAGILEESGCDGPPPERPVPPDSPPGHRRAFLMSEGLVCVEEEKGFGYTDSFGRIRIPVRYLQAEPFREGRAEVESKSGWGVIDKRGRYVLPPLHETLRWDEYYGVIAACRDGRWALFDRSGRALTGYAYDWMGDCGDGMLAVRRAGKWGYLDTCGCEAIPLVLDDAYGFRDGRALVRSGSEEFRIDTQGRRCPDEPLTAQIARA